MGRGELYFKLVLNFVQAPIYHKPKFIKIRLGHKKLILKSKSSLFWREDVKKMCL